MNPNIKVITPPTTEPLSIPEAKLYLRVDSDDTDYEIAALIEQAREYCEDYQGKKYITQTLDLYLDAFPTKDYIKLYGCSPVQTITSIKYYDTDGTEYTMNSNEYSLDSTSTTNKVYLNYGETWPSSILRPYNGVVIRVVVGYGAASAVPAAVKEAIKAHMKMLYDDLSDTDSRRYERVRDVSLGMRREPWI